MKSAEVTKQTGFYRKATLKMAVLNYVRMTFKYCLLHVIIALMNLRTDVDGAPVEGTRPNSNCTKTVNSCEPIANPICLGTILPYHHTSSVLIADFVSNSVIADNLNLWRGLQNIPKCWEVVQPLICAVYMPKCQTDNTTNISKVQFPAKELCEKTKEPCRILDKYKSRPAFLQCDHRIYVSGCTNDIMTAKFNTTGSCERPLISTSNIKSWYADIDGCGIQCQNPLFTENEHHVVHMFVAVFGSVSLISTLLTVLTFLLDWRSSSRYPAVILFFINACFFISSVGWMAQFIPGARKDIVCRSDGTMRKAEPQIGSGENSACTVIFIVVYYFMMAGVTWFVILTYALHLTYGTLGSSRDVIEGRRGHFHLVAWSLPLVLTIVCLALTQVDGDSLSGICFVGFITDAYRGGFVLLPVGLAVVLGLIFLFKGLTMLVRIQTQSPGLISDEASARIRDTIIRLGIFASFVLCCTIITFAIHINIFLNKSRWQQALEDYIACKSNITSYDLLAFVNPETCIFHHRPNIIVSQIHIFAYFGAIVIMSSWVWNINTLKSWKRKLNKMFCVTMEMTETKDGKEMNQLKNVELMPHLFAIQREINQKRHSFSFSSNRDDPLGMNLDLTSVTSRELSSSWAPAVQRMMLYRNSLHSSSGRQRRYSDSDVQSISSIFEQITMSHDVHSRQSQTRSSRDPSENSPSSLLNATFGNSSNMKRRRPGGHVKNNRIVPLFDSISIREKKDKKKDKKEKKRSRLKCASNTTLPFSSSGANIGGGGESSLAGYSSITCGSSYTAGNSIGGGSSLVAQSSTLGDDSIACGNSLASNSYDGRNAHLESAVSGSELSIHEKKLVALESSEPTNDVNLDDKNPKLNREDAEYDDEVFAESAEEEGKEKEEEEEEQGEEEYSQRSLSNYTVASSDTDALSIALDNEYQPVDPTLIDPPELKAIPPKVNVIKVSPLKRLSGGQKQSDPQLSADVINPTMHNSTQTSGFLPPFPNMQPHSPYSMFNYGGYIPPPMFWNPSLETPIWPPYGYPPYFYPYMEPRQFFAFPPSYHSQFTPPPPVPYDTLNQINPNLNVGTEEAIRASEQASSYSNQTGLGLSANRREHQGIQGSNRIQPLIGGTSSTAFRSPVTGNQSKGRGYDAPYNKSLLEMVELMTSQVDSGSDSLADSDSTPRQREMNAEEEQKRKSRRKRRHQWLTTVTMNNDEDCTDTSV